MGCGASIQAGATKQTKRGWFGNRRPPARAEAGTARAGAPAGRAVGAPAVAGTRITTPPVGAYRHPAGYHGLRIEANPHSTPVLPGRSDVGMAATPMGKMAEEFKYFCPLCMMFYKDIREMPCCKQYTCTFCLADFLHTKQHSPPAVATGAEASPPPEEPAEPPGVVLPSGVACPHCATVGTGQPLRLLDGKEEARSYLDSPKTTADLARVSSNSTSQSSNSPLKVGDDFQTMARKMLPFEPPPTCAEEDATAAACASTDPPAPDAAAPAPAAAPVAAAPVTAAASGAA